jgi:ADP-ribose pyrophosphatase YjhB (NUDIX family)
MDRPIRVAANAVVVQDGKALLVEFDSGTPRAHFNFPGGGVEAGETLEEAVRREVKEETCLDVAVERLLLVVESVASRNVNVIQGVAVPWNEVRFFFLCRPLPGSEARLPDTPDQDETAICWLTLEALPEVEVLPQVSNQLLAAIQGEAPLIVPNPPRWGASTSLSSEA